MKTLQPASMVEKVSGALATETALTVIAAIAGGALAPLLPVLGNTLAAGRQKARIERAVQDISDNLSRQGERIAHLSDNQYKVVNEIILALLQTSDQEKIDLLRFAISNALELPDIETQDAYFLSRLIRDISIQEVQFLRLTFGHEGIALVIQQTKTANSPFEIEIGTAEGRLAAGLISLGILAQVGGTIDDLGTFRFTPIAAKLLALLKNAP